MHKIDLSKYNLRTDLIIEKIHDNNILKEYEINNIKVSEANLEKGNSLLKKEGKYVTITFNDITDSNDFNNVLEIFTDELKKMLNSLKIKEDDTCLVIGLGNIKATPDALGGKTIKDIIVTRHLYLLDDCDPKYRNVSTFTPGVMGDTGIETLDIILGIISKIKPDFLIVIDSLCASSIERINKTIQMTDTGIHPGSGVGNNRKEISLETIGIPVIAIGVPTVVDSIVIVNDTIEYLMRKISYLKKNMNSEIDKLKPINKINYLKSDNTLSDSEKEDLLGKFGLLNDNDKKLLIYEVLSPINANMIVTVKEIDFIIDKLGKLLSNGLNKSLHKI